MKATCALVYKEWKQVRWYLLAGLVIFTGLPLIVMWSYYFKRHLLTTADAPEALVGMFGGLFAIFTAAGLVCPELKSGLAGFWRSRPVAVWKWALVKYVMGLLTVLVVCTLPLLLEVFLRRFQTDNLWLGDEVWTLLTCHTFILISVYSAAFLVSVLVGRPTHAVLLSMAIGLLIYFLPLLIPALERVSIFNWITHGKSPKLVLAEDGKNLNEYLRQIEGPGGQTEQIGPGVVGIGRVTWGYWFGSPHWLWLRLPGPRTLVFFYYPGYWLLVGVFLLASLLMVIGSIVSLHLHWRIRMNQKFLVWSLGMVAVVLFASAAFAIGSNMQVDKTISCCTMTDARFLSSSLGVSEGILVYGEGYDQATRTYHNYTIMNPFSCGCFDLQAPDLGYVSGTAWDPGRPDDLWLLNMRHKELEGGRHYRSLNLLTLQLDPEAKKAKLIDEQKLAEYTSETNSYPGGTAIVLVKNRLYAYVFGQLKVLDVSDPAAPEVIKTFEKWSSGYGESGGAGKVIRMMRPIPDDALTDEEKLHIAVQMSDLKEETDSKDKLYASVTQDFIRVYRLDQFEGGRADLESIVQRVPMPLERTLGNFPVYSFFSDGLLYVLYEGGLGSGMTVFEVSGLGDIRRAGHFAMPEGRFQAVSTLSDGRILLVGRDNIYILRPPRRKFTSP